MKKVKSNIERHCDLKIYFFLFPRRRPILLLLEFTDRIFVRFAEVPTICANSCSIARIILFSSFSFFVVHCVKSCFFFVSFEQDFIAGHYGLAVSWKTFQFSPSE